MRREKCKLEKLAWKAAWKVSWCDGLDVTTQRRRTSSTRLRTLHLPYVGLVNVLWLLDCSVHPREGWTLDRVRGRRSSLGGKTCYRAPEDSWKNGPNTTSLALIGRTTTKGSNAGKSPYSSSQQPRRRKWESVAGPIMCVTFPVARRLEPLPTNGKSHFLVSVFIMVKCSQLHE